MSARPPALPRCVEPMPRRVRKPWGVSKREPAPRPIVPSRVRAPLGRVARRLARWILAAIAYRFRVLGDRLTGRGDVRSRAIRLRETLLYMGGTAVKLGQQLSIRLDLLPLEYCEELGSMLDRVPPFPFEEARERIARAAGGRLEDVYESIDPEPIGSASIATVYRGVLKGGRRVAIKVQRPGIREDFNADLTALDWFLTAIEAVAIVRPGSIRHLKTELRSMLMEELDFQAEARYQMLFRRFVRRDRVRFLSVPRVHLDCSNEMVLVTDFVDGLPCTELLRIWEGDDPVAREALLRAGYDPVVLGKRILEVSYWGVYECDFLHGDPHPANIFFRPGNRIVLIDFGACTTTSPRIRPLLLRSFDRLLRRDAAGAASVNLQLMMPLPYIDFQALLRVFEEAIWWRLMMLQDKETPWWERTTAAFWIDFLTIARRFGLPANLDTVRTIRSSLLYDTIASRLWQQLDIDFFRKYLRGSRKRQERRARRSLARGRRWREIQEQARDTSEVIGRTAATLQTAIQTLPKEFQALSSKRSHAVFTLLRSGGTIASIFGFLAALRFGTAWWTRSDVTVSIVLEETLRHPSFQLSTILVVMVCLRRILGRLGDVVPGNEYRSVR